MEKEGGRQFRVCSRGVARVCVNTMSSLRHRFPRVAVRTTGEKVTICGPSRTGRKSLLKAANS